MRPLSASELLTVWERGQGEAMTTRALILLSAASPGSSAESLAKLSVGRRDLLLLTLREWLFGSRLVTLVACPKCSERLELVFEVSEIRAAAEEAQPETLAVRAGGYRAQFRLPNSEDLMAVAASHGARHDAQAMSEALLSRCLIQVSRTGRKLSPAAVESARDLPPALVAAIAEKMEQADPQANVQLDLACADCSHGWQAAFDIVSYLWSEIDHWARGMLREAHLLASTYGWREAEILAMTARRRQLYLEMIGGAR
jgi:hypothetical protein